MLKTLSFFVLFFSLNAHAASFSVRWWNMGGTNFWSGIDQPYWTPCYSSIGPKGELTAIRKVEKNLLKAALSLESPDVIALGEYVKGLFTEETENKLALIYPYQFHHQYNSYGRPYEVLLMSKQAPRETVYVRDALRWGSKKDQLASPDHDLYYLRSYQRLTFDVGGEELNIVPIHAAQPWNFIKQDTSFIESVWSMMFSHTNPSAYQGNVFQKILKAEKNWTKDHSTWLAIGDFNIPDKVLGVLPVAYRHFKGSMEEISISHGKIKKTFPSVSCLNYISKPNIRIDHAFLKSSAEITNAAKARIVPDQGSDHYPIQIDLQGL